LRAGLEGGVRGASDYPPNHFLRWNAAALEQAFTRAGYRRVCVFAPPPAPNEFMPGVGMLVPPALFRHLQGSGSRSGHPGSSPAGPALSRRLAATGLLLGHRLLRLGGELAGAPRAYRARRRGRTSSSLAVWAEP